MNSNELFKQLGLGDEEMESAREWVNYKHFSKTVPDVLTLSEYVNTVYKKAVTLDAKPHQWFSERYMTQRYLESDVVVDSKYIVNLEERIDTIFESGKELELHIQKFLELILNTVSKNKWALTKETLLFLNQIYKGKH